MTTKQTLLSLAERCEKLTEPCREMDAETEVLVNKAELEPSNCTQSVADKKFGDMVETYHEGRMISRMKPKPYTASIDAAIGTVPEDKYIIGIEIDPNGQTRCKLGAAQKLKSEWVHFRYFQQYQSASKTAFFKKGESYQQLADVVKSQGRLFDDKGMWCQADGGECHQ